MRKLTVVVAVLILLLAKVQTSAQEKIQANGSFMKPYCACNYDRIDGFFDKGQTQDRITLNHKKLVYGFPGKNAKVIDTIRPFTPINYLNEGTDSTTKINWIKVKYQERDLQGVSREKFGFITDSYISIGNVSANSARENLEFVLGESPLLDVDLKQPRFRLNAVYRPVNREFEKVSKVVTYDLNIGAINYYNHFYLTSINNTALSRMPLLMRLYWHHGESCPESEGHVFISYANGKMKELISAGSTGEAGFHEGTKVYIPVKFAKGKILLVENGDVMQMFDYWDASMKTIPYPKDCGIPISSLIVTVEEDTDAKTDNKGNFVNDKDGNVITEITHKVVRYYRWDGVSLKEAKKITIKQKKLN